MLKGIILANNNKKTTMNLSKYLFLLFLNILFSANAQYVNKQKNIVDIIAYEFTIEINDEHNEISAEALIQLKVLQKTDSVYLDFDKLDHSGKGMKIQSISLNQKQSPNYKHIDDKIVFYDTENWHNKSNIYLIIRYKGVPKDGLYISRNKYGKRTFFGDNWPNRAHYWLPVIDHPSDKAKVTFSIIAPKHYQIIATGTKLGQNAYQDKIVWHYQSFIPISTKVMVFAAADFKVKNYPKVLLSEQKLPVSSWIYKSSPDEGFDDYRCAIRVVSFYDSLVGPYSYEKLANVQSKTRFGGMENAGNIFYAESSVDGSKSVENLVAHEVAHQWFGNSVSEQNWSDIWLSEGFATYLTDMYLEHKYGKEKLKERMAMERNKVIRFNRYNAKPIVYNEQTRLMNLLNPNSYEKGAWVLHMLRQKIGDENFVKSLRVFYQKYRNKNASTSDFIDIVENISKQDLRDFFKQWLYVAGLPKLKMSYAIEGNTITFDVLQQNANLYQFTMPVKVVFGNNAQLFNLEINQKQQQFKFKLLAPVSEKEARVLFDPNVQVLFELAD